MNEMKILGFKRFVSKKGENTCIVQVVTEYSNREKDNGAVGMKCQDVFVPSEQYDYLKPEHVGRNLITRYGLGPFGRPVIIQIEVE